MSADPGSVRSIPRALLLAVFAALVLAFASPLAAQTEDPTTRARDAALHIGPLALAPSIALTNLGIDTNVYNEPDSLEPKHDFTFTVTPHADGWMHLGRTWLSGSGEEGLVYYHKYDSERSANHRYSGAIRVGLNRLVLGGSLSYANVRDRPGFEIDLRSRRTESGGALAAALRLGGKTTLTGRVDRLRVDFDKDAAFPGYSLQYELNRTNTAAGFQLRQRVTPLTTIGVDVLREQDRFEFSPLRDSDSTRVRGTLSLDPLALIKGSAAIGVRKFVPRSSDLQGFTGLTAQVDMSYVLLGSTRVGVQVGRDIQYSYDIVRPYYLQTGYSGSVSQQLFGPVLGVLRFGRQQLAYRNRIVPGAPTVVTDEPDRVRTYGGSVGYRLGRNRVVSFDVDEQQRHSPREGREYQGLRMGLSVTYAF